MCKKCDKWDKGIDRIRKRRYNNEVSKTKEDVMGNTRKKIVALVAAAAMSATAITGCGKINNEATLMTVGEDKVNMGVANFFARYQQAMAEAQYGAYMGDDMWESEVAESETMEESMKKRILESLKTLYVLENHMKDYKVELTAEEKQKIDTIAKEFLKANKDGAKEVVSADEDTVKRVLELLTIEDKMREAMVADVDKNVSDDEAAQKSMQYVFFTFTKTAEDKTSTTMDDDEKKALKEKATKFQEGAKAQADFAAYAKANGYEATTKTFDAKDTAPSEDLIKVVDKLKAGEMTGVVETPSGYYVAKVTSLLDRAATDKEKQTIIVERENKKYEELVKKFLKEAKIDVNKNEWKKISFSKQRVTLKALKQPANQQEQK